MAVYFQFLAEINERLAVLSERRTRRGALTVDQVLDVAADAQHFGQL